MSNSKYPNGLDTDAELPRVDDAITEIGGLAIDSLRSAVFAIEKALGVKPQGTAADLAGRLGMSLDANGHIKASALSGIGLVTLPITNTQVGSAAGIEESKLDLNYGTTLLKSWIDSLRVRVDALEVTVATTIAHFAAHVTSPSVWGRHRTSDIDAYDVFAGMNAQGALTNLDTRLKAHIADLVDAHDGSAISLDASRFSSITATDVQSGAEQLEALQLVEIVRHCDRHHGNGILGTQDAFLAGTSHGEVLIAASATTAASIGNGFIKFAVAPSAPAFQSISKNDRIDFVSAGGKTYTFVISGTQSTNQVNIFGSMPVSGVGTATVYKTAEETLEPSVAMVCMRQDTLSPRPSTLQIVHPSSPFIMSSGFRGSDLSASAANIRLLYPNQDGSGDTGNLDVYAAMAAFSAVKSTWTVENIARTINSQLFSPGIGLPRYPLVAFAYKGELTFAFDAPGADGYVEIGVPTANDATSTLGFVSGTKEYARSSRDLYIDGYEITSVSKLLDAYGQITASDTITFTSVNLLALGVKSGHLARITPYHKGTYVISDVTSSTIVFDSANEHDFTSSPSALNKQIRVIVYADAFSVSTTPTQHTLYEVFLDGYDDGYGPVAGLKASPRVGYFDTPAAPGSALKDILDVKAVSRTFGTASRRVFFDYSARTMVLGNPITGPSILSLGAKVTMPSSSGEGFRFTLYDTNGVDYLELEVASGLPGSDGYMDVSVYSRISEERFLQVATVLHDGTAFQHLDDNRQFGNVGRQDVRDDFTRDYVSYPRSLLRGNGVIYGFVVTGNGTGTLAVTGGQCLVDGQLKSVGKTSFTIPLDGATVNYNLFMDRDGVLRLMRDDYFASGVLSTPSTAELLTSRTETMLAKVEVSVANTITTIIDLRRFVNDIDSKLDLLVEENSITHGSFASLKAATDYLNSLPSSTACSRRIRVRGEVFLSESISIPRNTELVGDGYGSGGTSNRSARITYLTTNAAIQGNDGLVIRDLAFFRSANLPNGFIYMVNPFSYLTVEGCTFEFGTADVNNNVMVFEASLSYATIRENVFRNVATAIQGQSLVNYSKIDNNIFDNSDGTNGVFVNGVYMNQAYDVSISGNTMRVASAAMAAGTAFVRLGAGSGIVHFVWIMDNFLLYYGTQTPVANMAMIDVNGASVNTLELLIERNFLANTFSNTGFAVGILCAPTSSTATDVTVQNNHLFYFSTVSVGKGIVLGNCPSAIVSGNVLISCRSSFNITGNADQFILANNIVRNGIAEALDTTSCTSTGMSVLGNRFSTDGTGYNCSFYPTIDSATVCGNMFTFTGSSGYSLMFHSGTNFVIQGNQFLGTVFTVFPQLFMNANNNLVMGNILRGTPPVGSSRIYDGGTGNIEMLNKGQTYTVWVSPNRAVFASQWAMDINSGYSGFISQISATTTTTNNEAAFDFSALDLPAGAQLDKVTVWYGNSGATGDITFQLFTTDISTVTSTAISLVVDAVATGGFPASIDVTPTSTHYIPAGGTQWDSLVAVGKNGTSFLKIVFGIKITYIL